MAVIGTAGHVDHGKSTLVERLTGIDPDRFAEEKRRGLTIDLGFAWLTLPSGREVGLIDVPGHERFIRNMLAGAGAISSCLFVVAANEGWMAQSAEHLAIVDTLGLSTGVIAVTKADTVDDDTLELVAADIADRLAGSSLERAPIVPCSAVTGEGLPELVDALDDVLDRAGSIPDLGRPRLWVDRVFSIAGSGTVVTGSLMGGSLNTGDEVELSPRGTRARVRSIQSHKTTHDSIGPGSRVALNLVGLERRDAARGDAVVRPRQWSPTRLVDVRVRLTSSRITGRPHELTEKGAYLIYVGSAESPVRVRLLDRERVASGESGFAQLQLRDPLPITRGDRFVIRDAGRVLTLGGGEVLDPHPDPARGDTTARVHLLDRLAGTDPDGSLALLLDHFGELHAAEALSRSGAGSIPPHVTRLGSKIVSAKRLEELTEALTAAVGAHHETAPLEAGMPRETARAAVKLHPDEFDDLIGHADEVQDEGATVRLRGHTVALDDRQQRARDDLLSLLERDGFNPPLTKDLSVEPELLRLLATSGEIVRIGDFYLTRAQIEQVRELLRDRIERDGPVTVAQIRDLLGTSRKYAVPLCEWLDQAGITLRRGDVRLLGPRA